MKQKLSLRYILVLISCCGLSAAALGMLTNVAGVFFNPVAEDLNVGRGAVSLTYTISCLALAAGGLLSVRFTRKLPLKLVVISAGLLFGASTAGLGLANHIIILYFLSAMRGLAAGVIGNVLVTQIINSWFLKNTGTFTSIAMALSGLTGAIFSLILSMVISAAGWRSGYFVAAAVSLLFELPAMLFLTNINPKDAGCLPFGSVEVDNLLHDSVPADNLYHGSTVADNLSHGSTDADKQKNTASEAEAKMDSPHTSAPATKSVSPAAKSVSPAAKSVAPAAETVFPPADPLYADPVPAKTLLKAFLLVLAFAMAAAFATSYPQHFPGISESILHSSETGALMVTLCLIMNSAGKLTLGVLTDRFGTKRSVLLFSILLLLGFLLLLLVPRPFGMFPAAALIGLSYALSTVGIVMMVRTVFGLERYNQIYPKVVLFATVSGALGSSLIGFIYDGTGSYTLAVILVLVILALETASVLLVFRMKKQ